MVGQDRLLNIINSLSLDTMPRSLLLEGAEGSGKHLLCNAISDKIKLKLIDITDNLDFESISDMYLRSEPYIYLIDGDKLTIKLQNVILKFLEEPLKNSYIIILITNKYKLLPTILNRVQIWKLDKYSKETLQQFTDDKNILDIAETPGDIIKLKYFDIKSEIMFATKIIDKIQIASFPNTLTLSNHISFDNERDKIDIKLFFRIMLKVIRDKIISGEPVFDIYRMTLSSKQKISLFNVDTKYLFENYISNLWCLTHRRS